MIGIFAFFATLFLIGALSWCSGRLKERRPLLSGIALIVAISLGAMVFAISGYAEAQWGDGPSGFVSDE